MSRLSRILCLGDTNDDGPTVGVAELQGQPVWFEHVFDEEADTYADAFDVTPLPMEAALVALEAESLFARWLAEYNAGRMTLATHPYLPEDRARGRALKQQLETWRTAAAGSIRRVKGKARRVWEESAQLGKGWEIAWER